jgi:hypothetical protein
LLSNVNLHRYSVGTNYSPDETVFDPVYGPPEKYLDVKGVGSFLGLGAAVGWAQSKPDLFDAFSCGGRLCTSCIQVDPQLESALFPTLDPTGTK